MHGTAPFVAFYYFFCIRETFAGQQKEKSFRWFSEIIEMIFLFDQDVFSESSAEKLRMYNVLFLKGLFG